ncbi:hypothetical protein ACMD2_18643 [Ananas comosus]|uniref:Uncharacterized protein n=1 Tax=Ananas comosus TaxID=4615 RepID=A0A199UP60_ANACO|nr:hypothetical protein ACMD2_18643 [Ananas comosus]
MQMPVWTRKPIRHDFRQLLFDEQAPPYKQRQTAYEYSAGCITQKVEPNFALLETLSYSIPSWASPGQQRGTTHSCRSPVQLPPVAHRSFLNPIRSSIGTYVPFTCAPTQKKWSSQNRPRAAARGRRRTAQTPARRPEPSAQHVHRVHDVERAVVERQAVRDADVQRHEPPRRHEAVERPVEVHRGRHDRHAALPHARRERPRPAADVEPDAYRPRALHLQHAVDAEAEPAVVDQPPPQLPAVDQFLHVYASHTTVASAGIRQRLSGSGAGSGKPAGGLGLQRRRGRGSQPLSMSFCASTASPGHSAPTSYILHANPSGGKSSSAPMFGVKPKGSLCGPTASFSSGHPSNRSSAGTDDDAGDLSRCTRPSSERSLWSRELESEHCEVSEESRDSAAESSAWVEFSSRRRTSECERWNLGACDGMLTRIDAPEKK